MNNHYSRFTEKCTYKMEIESTIQKSENDKSRSGCLRLLGIAAVCALVIALIVVIWVKYNVYASPFHPTALSGKEQQILDSKMSMLGKSAEKEESNSPVGSAESESIAKPEPYSEAGARRGFNLSEKELNALIANNPDVARKVAIDLSDNLISIKLVLPVDEEIIFLGGKTLRLNMGIILSYEEDKPFVGIKGISVGGIPLPNAWLGYTKGQNLIEEFGTETGFWKLFTEGVKDISVKEGRIRVSLKE